MQTENKIYETKACFVVQEPHGETLVYRVMSKNNICLTQSASAPEAIEYADWFTGKNKH